MTTEKVRHSDTIDSSASDENVLSMYLKEINRVPLLTREQENDYAARAADGDKAAKDILIKSNLRFVVNVAKKYQNQGLPLSDLISEGNIGLINAIERYDVNKGYHFISYAVWWIRQAILKAICEKSRMIRLPLNRANELVQIEKARKNFEGISEESEIKEVARYLNMDSAHVAEILAVSREMVSLSSPIHDEKNASVLGDFVGNDAYQSPENYADELNLKDDINKVLSMLTIKERQVIEYRFGLNGRRPMSLKEIGDHMNLTKERIRQIEKAALKKISVPEVKEQLEAYVA